MAMVSGKRHRRPVKGNGTRREPLQLPYGRPMGDNRWMVRPNEEKSFFRSFDLADETGSPGKSVDIGDSSNTETDARL